MSDHAHAGDDYQADPESLARGYEAREPNARGLLWFGAIFLAVLGVIQVVVWVTYRTIAHQDQMDQAERSPLVEPPAVPTGPMLQPSVRHNVLPWQDLRDTLDEARQKLTGYGWVNEASGVAHIPVDQAMRLVVARQKPPASSAPSGAATEQR